MNKQYTDAIWAIVVPLTMAPAVATLIWLERRASKRGLITSTSAGNKIQAAKEHAELNKDEDEKPVDEVPTYLPAAPVTAKLPWHLQIKQMLIECDTFGLLLLGFGWSLVCLQYLSVS